MVSDINKSKKKKLPFLALFIRFSPSLDKTEAS